MSHVDPESLLKELDRLEGIRDVGRQEDSQRAYRRLAIRGQAELYPPQRRLGDAPPVEIQLRDLGRGGMGFICVEPLEVGSVWRVQFEQHGYAIAHQSIAVRHCRKVKDQVYLVGSQFVMDEGLMVILGVQPDYFRRYDESSQQDDAAFLPPEAA